MACALEWENDNLTLNQTHQDITSQQKPDIYSATMVIPLGSW